MQRPGHDHRPPVIGRSVGDHRYVECFFTGSVAVFGNGRSIQAHTRGRMAAEGSTQPIAPPTPHFTAALLERKNRPRVVLEVCGHSQVDSNVPAGSLECECDLREFRRRFHHHWRRGCCQRAQVRK